MAIFWNHLKGTNSSKLYSWISWTTEATLPKEDENYTFDYAPEIKVANMNDESSAATLGHILTSAIDHTLVTKWTWGDSTKYINIQGSAINSAGCSWTSANAFILSLDSKASLTVNSKAGSILDITTMNEENTDNNVLTIGCHTRFLESVNMEAAVTINSNLTVSDFCKAQYFSAVSDKRAKENIKECAFSALDFINSVSVYSFNYKNKNTPTIGIMAQDICDSELQNFLVDNRDATGINEDYMSLRESKIVYVLWKAIQEQQTMIKTLTNRIEELERGKIHE